LRLQQLAEAKKTETDECRDRNFHDPILFPLANEELDSWLDDPLKQRTEVYEFIKV
jgi:hypothetical protein